MNGVRQAADSGRSILRTPALKAGAVQLLSFLVVLVIGHLLMPQTEAGWGVVAAALLQGAVAALLSRLAGLAPWWLAIQALFPIALVVTLSFQLPPSLFLAGFLVLLAVFWSTFRTQVPLYPSRRATWQAVTRHLPVERGFRFVDIGSGLGGLLLHASAVRKSGEFVGVELAPLPWLISKLRGMARRSNARFIRADYAYLDLAAFDVVFAYLSPAAMPDLWKKAQAEMRPGSLLLSYEFVIPGVRPQLVEVPEPGGPTLYGWRM